MKVPQLKRKLEVKKYHSFELKDEFSWVHQKDILSVLKDSSKLHPEVKKYLKDENAYTKYQMQDTEKFQKKLFQEIKGRIKLDDESLHFFYIKDGWEYWTKTTKENNYSIQLRKKIGNDKNKTEEYWNGDEEKKKLGVSYFGVGDLSVSHNHSLLGYSLDLNGSEYYTIYVRRISDEQIVSEKTNSSSSLVFRFLTNNLGRALDTSPLIIQSSRKSNPPITTSFLAGIKSSQLLLIFSCLHLQILKSGDLSWFV